MSFKILIMGLPGSGKTTLAQELIQYFRERQIDPDWINADVIRKKFNDWDFSSEGRIRQSKRLTEAANESLHPCVVCDFVAALPEQRIIFNPDYLVWMDTIKEGRYADTNAAFVPPTSWHFRVTELNAVRYAGEICIDVIKRTAPRIIQQDLDMP